MRRPFPKGNKLAGSRKGIQNKKTVQWEAFSKWAIDGGVVRFKKELEGLDGKDFVDAFLKLLEFHKPKLTRSTVTGENGGPVESSITVIFKDGNRNAASIQASLPAGKV